MIALAYLPWVPVLRQQLDNAAQYGWFEPVWEGAGPLGILWGSVRSLAPGSSFLAIAHTSAPPWAPAATWVVLSLLLVAVVQLAMSVRRTGLLRAGWLPLAVFVPMASAILASSWVSPHYVAGRVDQLVLGPFALLTAVGLCAIPWRVVRAALGVALLLASACTLKLQLPEPNVEAYAGGDRALAHSIRAEAKDGDFVLFTSLSRASVQYYLELEGADLELENYPRSTAEHLGNQDDQPLLDDPAKMVEETRAVLDRAWEHCGAHRTFFLVLVEAEVNRSLDPRLLVEHYPLDVLSNDGTFVLQGAGAQARVFAFRFTRGR